MIRFDGQYVVTSGVFDLSHLGHVESILRIRQDSATRYPGSKVMIAVVRDDYVRSYKREPYQSLKVRMNALSTAFKSLDITVVEDPLLDVNDYYRKEWYEANNIVAQYQGSDFPENPKVYEYFRGIGRFHTIGRSEIGSTTDLISRVTSKTLLEDIGGHSNDNYKFGGLVIKRIKGINHATFDSIYSQLKSKGLFGVTRYQRMKDLVLLPYIEGDIASDLNKKDLDSIRKSIIDADISMDRTVLDLFADFEFYPDMEEFKDILLDEFYPSHGDLVYTNVIKSIKGIFLIDWEYACRAPKYYDTATYYMSLYAYDHKTLDEVIFLNRELNLTMRLAAKYWIQWSKHTGVPYFGDKMNEYLKATK